MTACPSPLIIRYVSCSFQKALRVMYGRGLGRAMKSRNGWSVISSLSPLAFTRNSFPDTLERSVEIFVTGDSRGLLP